MKPEDWPRVRASFEALIELSAEQRSSALADLDPEHALEVRRLLDAEAQRDTARFEALAHEAAQVLAAAADAGPQRIGPWRVLRLLGSGGMGCVYLGERQTPSFTQLAAIKLLRAGWNGAEARRRFEAEQRVLASLGHPNIAHLIDGGIDAHGAPWLALEYVDGLPLDAHARSAGLDAQARVRLFLEVCAAVEHAHQRLIVHRDLKPGNILVARDGAVKLLDFGIAKLLGEDSRAAMTSTGVRLFTPGYAAPEQLRGEAVSTATDGYALGMVLYELLTGRLPFDGGSASAVDWERVVLSQEPLPPSRLTRSPHAVTQANECVLPAAWSGDFDAIALKAIRREPDLRYASVAALRADLQALLENRPVAARRGTRRYRWRKFARRHALALGLGCLAGVALVAGTGVALWQANAARLARERADARAADAQEAARRAQATVSFLTDVFAAASPGTELGPEPTARDLLRAGEARIADNQDLDPLTRASMQQAIGYAHVGLNDLDAGERMLEAALASAREAGDLRAETHALLSLATHSNMRGNTALALERFEEADRLLVARGNHDPMLQAYVDRMISMEYMNADRPAEALARVSRAYAAAVAELDPLAPEVTATLSVYMAALNAADRAAEGVRYTTPSFQALASATDVPASRRLSVMASHSMALRMAGRLEEALDVARQCLRLAESLFGPDDRRLVEQHYRIGSVLRLLGQHRRSAEVFEIALRIAEASLPEKHFSRLGPAANAAQSWLEAGEPVRARPLLEKALAGYRERGEYASGLAMRARWTLVQLLLREHRDAEASAQLYALDLDKLDSETRVKAQALRRQFGGKRADG